jgi:hypothetical protein
LRNFSGGEKKRRSAGLAVESGENLRKVLWKLRETTRAAMAVSKYILVSLPLRGSTASSSSTWENLQRDISKIAFDIPTYKVAS